MVYDWDNAIELIITPTKWEALIIRPQSNRIIEDFDVLLNHTTIRAKDDIKYLSVLLDSKLNFRKHLEFTENKRSRAVSILR